jgi:NAD-dependent dihydropyrimidine dehydrogenase PreA subunit
MTRNIVRIDADRCDGCGLCADACHEGAIAMIGGKSVLVRDDCCDGLGNCLPVCPAGAISIEHRAAAEFSRSAVEANRMMKTGQGCPGGAAREFGREGMPGPGDASNEPRTPNMSNNSCLSQWPVQIKLMPANAPCLDGAHLLISADCAAYARADFHRGFMSGRVTLIGCPKLDNADYSRKLAEILARNDIKSVTVVRMEVPCCGGIEHAAVTALNEQNERKSAGETVPPRIVTLSVKGEILSESQVL